MQISNVPLVLSATSASFATPVAKSAQADFEAIAARYGIELTEAGARDFTTSAEHCYGGGPSWGGEKSDALNNAGSGAPVTAALNSARERRRAAVLTLPPTRRSTLRCRT
jgi:hypothetical protein